MPNLISPLIGSIMGVCSEYLTCYKHFVKFRDKCFLQKLNERREREREIERERERESEREREPCLSYIEQRTSQKRGCADIMARS